MSTLGKKGKTQRGFELVKFKDDYGAACSLQQSSAGDRIWLGVDDPDPKVLATQAHRVQHASMEALAGVKTDVMAGWVPFPIHKEVLLTTRMHLNLRQTKALIRRLKRWVDKGNL